ncbi:MAG TPA: SIS domain-containing protein [Armatimonadota bacterium]|nr:SIS domain-containing protein [Armatimonadota bacterium]
MWAERFFDVLKQKLEVVQSEEGPAIAAAAEALADTLSAGGLVYVFGCGHSAALTMDLFYRAGGLMLIHPIFDDRILLNHRPVTETTEWEQKQGWAPDLLPQSGARPGDAVIVFSTSGRNGAPIDIALTAKEIGLTVIAVTSRAYASSLPSRHSSGKRLHEVADLVIDNHVDPGDASLSLPGLQQKVGPTSTVLGSAIAQALIVEAMARLIEKGETPPVYISANLPGGSEQNQQVLSRYRDRLRFL